MVLEEILEQAGFNKNEAKIYLAILLLGKGNLSEVARKANTNRVNSLDKVRKLVKKQLIRPERIGKRWY